MMYDQLKHRIIVSGLITNEQGHVLVGEISSN